jgi:MFS family permease
VPVLKRLVGAAEYTELAALFFVQMMAMGMWLVPLSRILEAHGYAGLRSYAYATSAVAAFVSPLVFGAMADRHASPVSVLRWLAIASAAAAGLSGWSVARGWHAPVVLGLIQIYSFVAVPTSSITSTIIFSRLKSSQRQFGPIRAVGTFGWMCGCWLISIMNVDASPFAPYAAGGIWIALAAFTNVLPSVAPPLSARPTFRERMGWDALVLLKHHDHRVVFFTVALFSIPLAAFYPLAPLHLKQLGFVRTTAWMSCGQITEIVGMLCLAALFGRWRLKWIIAAGLAFGVIRFALAAMNKKWWVMAGVTLHGFSFTLCFITAQIYLNERVEAAWRARAQSLMSLMTSGVGNLLGYLGTGAWFNFNARNGGAPLWPTFWGGLSAAAACVLVFFLFAYHGAGRGFRKARSAL